MSDNEAMCYTKRKHLMRRIIREERYRAALEECIREHFGPQAQTMLNACYNKAHDEADRLIAAAEADEKDEDE